MAGLGGLYTNFYNFTGELNGSSFECRKERLPICFKWCKIDEDSALIKEEKKCQEQVMQDALHKWSCTFASNKLS
jgi:hypothetical protein